MYKILFTYITLFIFLLSFSQKTEKRTYHFDYMYKTKNNIHNKGIYSTSYHFINSKDSTYNLKLEYSEKNNIAIIFDKKKIDILKFDSIPIYKKIDDLKILDSCTLYTKVYPEENKVKNTFSEVKFEHDSINDNIIIHKIFYKNSKKKKILFEKYFIFTKNKKLISNYLNLEIKQHFIINYKIDILKDFYLEKILFIKESKIDQETIFLENEKVNYDLSFTIKKVI